MKFHCQTCGQIYQKCRCKVYVSYFAGTGRMTDNWNVWRQRRKNVQKASEASVGYSALFRQGKRQDVAVRRARGAFW